MVRTSFFYNKKVGYDRVVGLDATDFEAVNSKTYAHVDLTWPPTAPYVKDRLEAIYKNRLGL